MDYRKKFRVEPGDKVKLKKLDPAYTGKHEVGRRGQEGDRGTISRKLVRQQLLLYAEHKHSILVVLQALDAGGKDGTIKHVFSGAQSAGRRRRELQAADRRPSSRMTFCGASIPMRPDTGEIAIFNRSHYEDVLVTRVHKLIDKDDLDRALPATSATSRPCSARTETTILKFFLHIGKEEQLARFAQRLDDPARNWKISEADYSERPLWDDYVEAFEDAIAATSTQGGAVVRYSLESQVVPQSGGVADHGRHDGGAEACLPPAVGRPCRTSGASISCAQEREDRQERRLERRRRPRDFHKPASNDKEGPGRSARDRRRSNGERGRKVRRREGRDSIVTLACNPRARRLLLQFARRTPTLRRLLTDQGVEALEGLRLRLRDDGPDRAHDLALGLDHRQDRRQDLRRPRPQGGLGDHRGDRGDLHGQGPRDLRPAGRRCRGSATASSPTCRRRIFDQMLRMKVELLQPRPFVRIHRPAGVHRPVGEHRRSICSSPRSRATR